MTAAAWVYGVTVAITLAAAAGVLLSRRPVMAGYLLTVTMIGVAALFWDLDSSPLAGIQVLVYGGGVLVMVLFVIMVTSSGQRLPAPRPGWRAVWILPPAGGILAALSYPARPRPIGGVDLGRWLLLRQGMALETMAMLLLVALVAAVAIVLGRQERTKS